MSADEDHVTETEGGGQVEVHWQHPRTEFENPVLLVWPGAGLRDKWAAEIVDEGVAWVLCHTMLYEDAEGDVQKAATQVSPNEPIPAYVAEALLGYEGNYGPVETVTNPVADDEGEATAGVQRENHRVAEYQEEA